MATPGGERAWANARPGNDRARRGWLGRDAGLTAATPGSRPGPSRAGTAGLCLARSRRPRTSDQPSRHGRNRSPAPSPPNRPIWGGKGKPEVGGASEDRAMALPRDSERGCACPCRGRPGCVPCNTIPVRDDKGKLARAVPLEAPGGTPSAPTHRPRRLPLPPWFLVPCTPARDGDACHPPGLGAGDRWHPAGTAGLCQPRRHCWRSSVRRPEGLRVHDPPSRISPMLRISASLRCRGVIRLRATWSFR